MWPWKRRRKRDVLLKTHRRGVILPAVPSQSGWLVRVDDVWFRLRDEGKIDGPEYALAWYPHSGWRGDEFSKWPEGCSFGGGED